MDLQVQVNSMISIVKLKDEHIAKLESEILLLKSELEKCYLKINAFNQENSNPQSHISFDDDDWSNFSNNSTQNPFSYLLKPAPLPPSDNLSTKSSNYLSVNDVQVKKHRGRKKSLPESLPSIETPKIKKKKPRSSLPPIKMKPIVSNNHATVIQSFIRGKIQRIQFKNAIQRQIQKRRFSLLEILNAEKSYNHILMTIIKYFKNTAKQSDLFTYSEIKSIFINIDDIYESSCRFYKSLEALFKEDPLYIGHRIGMLFLKTIPEWKMYSIYCNLYDKSLETIKSCKERKATREWFKKYEYTDYVHKLGLNDLLIAPIKRIPQYELLLKEVKNNTPKNSRHYTSIRTSKSMISELAQYINEKRKEIENLEIVRQIEKSFTGSIPELCQTGREFIDETIAYECTDDHQYIEKRVILFNDCLLISSSTNRFDRLIYFNDANVSDVSEKKLEISIDKFSILLLFPNTAVKSSWHHNIRNFIETIKYENEHSLIKDFLSDRVEPRVVKSMIIIEGILHMKRPQNKSWEKRWFVLEQGYLYYFKYKNTNKEKGSLDLSLFFLKEDKKNTNESKNRYAFELYNHKYEGLHIYSDSEQSRAKWIECIKSFTLFGKKDQREIIENRGSEDKRDLLLLSSDGENKSDPLGLKDSRFYFNEDSMNRQSNQQRSQTTVNITITEESSQDINDDKLISSNSQRSIRKRSHSWTKESDTVSRNK